jgi:NAD(P)-dependent dehydrogenase (short-subunit alcohol dehydrogenase family)
MVRLKDMRASLADFKRITGFVAVVVGGTSGIGEATVRSLAKHTQKASVYIVGRNATAADRILADCQGLSPSSKFEFVCQDVALLRGVDQACDAIREKEEKVDLLFMTPDFMTFGGRDGKSPTSDIPLPFLGDDLVSTLTHAT